MVAPRIVGEGLRIDPWSSQQSTDYSRIRDEFGLGSIEGMAIPNPSMLHRRGIIFAQRDLDVVLDSSRRREPFGVLTGLMPSGRMHLGHSMVIEQVKWFQSQGADVTIAVADLEAHATRGMSLDDCRTTALKEYVLNYAALGLESDSASVYFQSRRPIVQRIGFTLGKRTTLSEMESIYGFQGETNLAHIQAPLVQVGDILHPQFEEFGGIRPIVVPVGVDQDPHIRLTRDLASRSNWFNVKPRKAGGLSIALSIQEENSSIFGVGERGRVKEFREDENRVIKYIQEGYLKGEAPSFNKASKVLGEDLAQLWIRGTARNLLDYYFTSEKTKLYMGMTVIESSPESIDSEGFPQYIQLLPVNL